MVSVLNEMIAFAAQTSSGMRSQSVVKMATAGRIEGKFAAKMLILLGFFARLKVAMAMTHITRGVITFRFDQEEPGMRLRTLLAATALTALFAAAPAMAQPHDHDGVPHGPGPAGGPGGPPHGPGDWDAHHEWRDQGWWHDNHPEWIREHHPEWYRDHPDWRNVAEGPHGDGDWDDHHVWHDDGWWYRNHPEWIREHHPEWYRHHPDWRGDGDWDDHHVWRDHTWWWNHHPEWVREHHPHWAEAHGH